MKNMFWSYDYMLIYKNYSDPAPHKHFAKHLAISIDGEFESIVEDAPFYCKGVCIGSNVEHTVRSDNKGLLIFLFDETSVLAKALEDQCLQGAPFCRIDEEHASKIVEQWKNSGENDIKCVDDAIRSMLNVKKDNVVKYDDRVCDILSQISEMECIYKDTFDTLCNSVYLSRSRVSHLFKKQVGVSLSSYLLFEKMRKTYLYVSSGENITTACMCTK